LSDFGKFEEQIALFRLHKKQDALESKVTQNDDKKEQDIYDDSDPYQQVKVI
jgi:hypothetical protein